MESRIQGKVAIWREHGEWRLLIHAPRWVIGDISDDLSKGGVLRQANMGGEGGTGIDAEWSTMIIVRMPAEDQQPASAMPEDAP